MKHLLWLCSLSCNTSTAWRVLSLFLSWNLSAQYSHSQLVQFSTSPGAAPTSWKAGSIRRGGAGGQTFIHFWYFPRNVHSSHCAFPCVTYDCASRDRDGTFWDWAPRSTSFTNSAAAMETFRFSSKQKKIPAAVGCTSCASRGTSFWLLHTYGRLCSLLFLWACSIWPQNRSRLHHRHRPEPDYPPGRARRLNQQTRIYRPRQPWPRII